jgi:subtilase family serine protease
MLLGWAAQGYGQGYQMPVNGTSTVTGCSGTLYDNGGPAGNYSANVDGTTILRPPNAGSRIQLQFTQFDTEAFYDRVTIYDGPSINDPILGLYDGTVGPGTVVATNASGALTVRFMSDGATSAPGFAATISCVPVAPLPDLFLQAASVNPQAAVAGGPVTANVILTNGSVTTANSSNIGYYLSRDMALDAADVLVGNSPGGTWPGGASGSRTTTLTIPAATTNGNYYLLFVADYQNQVNEANELNNLVAVPLAVVPPGVDLLVQSASVAPTTTAPGNTLNFNCVLINQGTTVAASSNLGFYLSTDATLDAADQVLATSLGGAMAPSAFGVNRFATGLVPTGTAPGNYFVLFVADPQNQVSETNELNNVLTRPITVVAPSVDLTIAQASNTLAAAAGGVVSLSAYVLNQGNTTAPSSNMAVYLSSNTTLDAADPLVFNSPGGQLSAGLNSFRSGSFNVPAGTTPGNYFLLYVADPQNLVGETNELNNMVSRTLTVQAPLVDLQVQQPGLNPTVTVAGGTVNASAYLYNAGNSLAGASQMGFYFSTNTTLDAADVLLTTRLLAPLTAGTYLSTGAPLTIPTGTTPGTYYILFAADMLNQVAESDEQNNLSSAFVTVVVPRVDLQVVQPFVNPTVTTAGSVISVSSYVSNIGNTPSVASSLGYYLSTDLTLDAADVLLGQAAVPGLQASGFYNVFGSLTLPASATPGSYYLLFVADHLNAVSEVNELNNVATAALSIVTPGVDLILNQATLNRGSVAAGGTLTGNSYIYNQGTTTAASSAIGYYLSTDNVLSANDVLLTTTPGILLPARYGEPRTGSMTVPATTAPGAYFVLFVADPQNAVTETNELNNTASVPVTVGLPFAGTVVPKTGSATLTSCGTTVYDHGGTDDYEDYANGTLTISPGTAGARVRLTLTSFNTESGFDYLRVYDGPSINSPLLASYNGIVAAGTAVTATNAAGVLTLQFTSDGSVVRSGFEAAVACVGGSGNPGTPDLLIQAPTASPITVGAGSSMGLGATILNQGTGDAASSTIGYYLSTNATWDAGDVLIGTSAGGVLAAGGTATRSGSYNVPASLTAGVYQLLIVADPQNAVTESNEQNNVAHYATPITVTATTGGPDLTVTQLTVLPNPVPAGGNIAVTAFHQNMGTVSAAAHSVAVYLSADNTLSANDVLLTSSSVSSMAPSFGITRVLTGIQVPSGTAAGAYFVLFVVDSQNAVTETNEQNNTASVALRVDPGTPLREQAGGYSIGLLPNPTATGTFEVRFDGVGVAAAAELTLFNSLGQQVARQPLTLRGAPARAVFSTEQLSRGVYTLRITGKGLNATRRVVVE